VMSDEKETIEQVLTFRLLREKGFRVLERSGNGILSSRLLKLL